MSGELSQAEAVMFDQVRAVVPIHWDNGEWTGRRVAWDREFLAWYSDRPNTWLREQRLDVANATGMAYMIWAINSGDPLGIVEWLWPRHPSWERGTLP